MRIAECIKTPTLPPLTGDSYRKALPYGYLVLVTSFKWHWTNTCSALLSVYDCLGMELGSESTDRKSEIYFFFNENNGNDFAFCSALTLLHEGKYVVLYFQASH
jgi:hypothetical protein